MIDAHDLSVDGVSISFGSLFAPPRRGSFSRGRKAFKRGVSFSSRSLGLRGLTSLLGRCAGQPCRG